MSSPYSSYLAAQHEAWKRDGAKPVHEGEIWMALKPGQDKAFPTKWVSRRTNGEAASIVNSRSELVENAGSNLVRLLWVDPWEFYSDPKDNPHCAHGTHKWFNLNDGCCYSESAREKGRRRIE